MKKLAFATLFLLTHLTLAHTQDMDLAYLELDYSPPNPALEQSSTAPQFPGGPEALAAFLNEAPELKQIARNKKVEGMITVQVTILPDGRLENPQVVQGLTNIPNKAVLDLVRVMPHWIPATRNGQAVKAEYLVPIILVNQ